MMGAVLDLCEWLHTSDAHLTETARCMGYAQALHDVVEALEFDDTAQSVLTKIEKLKSALPAPTAAK